METPTEKIDTIVKKLKQEERVKRNMRREEKKAAMEAECEAKREERELLREEKEAAKEAQQDARREEKELLREEKITAKEARQDAKREEREARREEREAAKDAQRAARYEEREARSAEARSRGLPTQELRTNVIQAFLNEQQVKVVSPASYSTITSTSIDAVELSKVFYIWLVEGGLLTTMMSKAYWEAALEVKLAELYEAYLTSLAASIKHEKVSEESSSALRSFLKATLKHGGTEVEQAIFKQFIWQVKRKLLRLPVAYHLMPILWGVKQGTGKTRALTAFLEPLGQRMVYSGLAFDRLGDDRYYRLYELYPIVFFDEMARVGRADIESVKNVISAGILHGRILASHKFKDYKQNTTFIGATNSTPGQLIKDTSGMRRFAYVEARANMDWKQINNIDFMSIWRGVDEFSGEPPILKQIDALAIEQEETRDKDALEHFILEENIMQAEAPESFVARDAYEIFKNFATNCGYVHIYSLQSFNQQLQSKFGFVKCTEGKKATKFIGRLKKDARLNQLLGK